MRRIACLTHLTTGILALMLLCCFYLFGGATRGERIAMDALGHLDAPYVLGKAGPEQFDCSGLIVHCFKKQGVSLSHSAEDIGADARGRALSSPAQLRTGDIVCFDTVQDRDPSDHVGIWLGGNRFVHASSAKGKVIVSELTGYYLEHFTGGRRILCPYF